jgi:glycosyltransferase involved in cell wall biosynthesis
VPFRYPDSDPKRRRHAQEPFLRSARQATRVIAVSNFGQSEVHGLLNVPNEKIAVIPHGVDASFSPGPPESLPEVLRGRCYFLFVGDPIAEPRKNFALLYEAYRCAWPAGDGPGLAIAGARDPQVDGVIYAGTFDDDVVANQKHALRACYRGALALTLASYHETFGMPILEAMACGTPVVASQASALPEIAGDAALYAPPHDAGSWAAALARVADDASLRAQLSADGLRRAAQFTWDESARRHVELFADLAR